MTNVPPGCPTCRGGLVHDIPRLMFAQIPLTRQAMVNIDSPERPDTSIQVRETHMGGVLLVGSLAWKFKKPIDLGFADFSSVAARRRACEREVELNSRFAPDVYLGVATLDLPGRVHEPLVAMRRLPDDRRLANLIRLGKDVDDALREIARTVAAVHARSPRTRAIDECAGDLALRTRWQDNLAQARRLTPPVLVAAEIDAVAALADSYVEGRRRLFERRVESGCAVDGHGDLTAEDIFCMSDGPRLLDCLEFDHRLRYVDRIDDASFLAMDLHRLGAPKLALRFIDLYREYTGDNAPPSLIEHYMAYRAMVRAKVTAIRATQDDGPARFEAQRLLNETRTHLQNAEITLTLVGGLPGTGKSTLAHNVADRFGQVLLSSDRVRKELLGFDPRSAAPAAFGEGVYSPATTATTYSEMLRRGEQLLHMGESVVLDATWSDPELRKAARRTAASSSTRVVELRCCAPSDVIRRRLNERARHHALGARSDADPGIATAINATFAPWPQATEVDTQEDPSTCLSRIGDLVRPTLSQPMQRPRSLMSPD